MLTSFSKIERLAAVLVLAGLMVPQVAFAKGHHSGNGHKSGQMFRSSNLRINTNSNNKITTTRKFQPKTLGRKVATMPQRVTRVNQFPYQSTTGGKTLTGTKNPLWGQHSHPSRQINVDPSQVPPLVHMPPKGQTPPKDPSHDHHNHHHRFPWQIFVPAFGGGYYGGGYYGGGGCYGGGSYPVYPTQSVAVSQPAPAAIPAAATPAVAQTTGGSVDLMLEDLQFAEPATLLAGPAYRVKFRNQSLTPVGSFRVALLADNAGQPTADSPRSMVEVAGLAAGEASEITIRLPKSASGQSNLFVAVDVDGAISELDESNNIAIVERAQLETAAR